MSLDIVFPNESKMKVKDFDKLKEKLCALLMLKNIGKKEIEKLNVCLGEIQGYLLVADRKNLKEYFKYFCDLNILNLFNSFLEKGIEAITFSILKMVSFLVINIQNKELLEYIYSKKFPAGMFGQTMNIIDILISLNNKSNEEYLTYQINFIKSLTLKINIDTLNYFYDCNINQFPILTKSLSLYNYGDPLIRNVVKNIVLAIIKIENNNLREFLISFPIHLYYPNIIFQLKNAIMELISIDLGKDEGKKTFGQLQKQQDFIVDTLMYLDDLLSLNIEKINYIIINCLLNEIILPLIYSLDKGAKIPINYSLYLICLLLFTNNKNSFLYDIITHFLFNQKVPDSLYKKITCFTFTSVDKKIMEIINFLITNYLYADINEPGWQEIKKFMKYSTGTDLSTGDIDFYNIYDFSKNIMNMSNYDGNIDNPIFVNIQTYLKCNDDGIILILNLIINSCISFYKKLPMEKKYYNINDVDDVASYNLLSKNIFQKDFDNCKTENIINILFKILCNKKSFRLATYEIILNNIQLLIKTFLENNDNNKDYKQKLTFELIRVINEQFSKMEELLRKDASSNKFILDSCIKAYEHYIKNVNKKINDLITLPNILVPLIYLDKIEEIPEHLKDCKKNNELFRNYIFNIFFLNDIINDIYDNKDDIIKSKKFPLQIETIKFSIGKEYSEKDLGEDFVPCKIKRNNNFVFCQAILSYDTFYLGEIMSGNFNDLSKIKIFKKIPLRYIEVKNDNDPLSLSIIDKSNAITQKNPIILYFLDENNKFNSINYFIQQIAFCLDLEESLFNSYMEEMKKKLFKLL